MFFMRRYNIPRIARGGSFFIAYSHLTACFHSTKALRTVDFEDTTSYKEMSTWALIKALFVLKVCSIDYFARNSVKLMRLSEKIVGQRLTYNLLVRKTIYDYFCAGENDYELKKTIQKLDRAEIGAILDYAAEADSEGFAPEPGTDQPLDVSMSSLVNNSNVQYLMDENIFDDNMKLYMIGIMHASLHNPSGNDGHAAVKVTGMCDPQLLARVSAILMSIHQNWRKHFTKESTPKLEECRVVMGVNHKSQMYITYDQLREGFNELKRGSCLTEEEFQRIMEVLDPNKEGKVNYFHYKEVLTEAATALEPTPAQVTLIDRLPSMSDFEKSLWRNVVRRHRLIASTARALNVRVMIDAEQTFYQLAIDALVVYLQKQYNTKYPVVYNTYQCYLTYAEDRVANDLTRAALVGFHWGGKMVRGAYMVQERTTAEKYGYTSPVWATYEETGKCYENVARRVLDAIESAPSMNHEVFFGTHNRHALEKITNMLLKRPSIRDKVSFGQLYGMRDNLTIPLAKAGFKAFKYVPYGPVKETVHYLGRRAIENSSVLCNADCEERKMMNRELKRRFKLVS